MTFLKIIKDEFIKKVSMFFDTPVMESAKPEKLGEAEFKEIIPDLSEIITLKKKYHIYEIKDGKAHLYLDNDFGHWIPLNKLKRHLP